MLIKRFLPLFIFLGIFIAFMTGLFLNPRDIPSALINKPVPELSLPPLQGAGIGLDTADVTAPGTIIIVNFFASWCGPCRVEHPALDRLSKIPGVKLYGIAYKDRPANSLIFLKTYGNPYDKTAADLKGRNAINWGVTGTPETFFIKNGIIRYQHIGPLYEAQIDSDIRPMILKLQQEDPS